MCPSALFMARRCGLYEVVAYPLVLTAWLVFGAAVSGSDDGHRRVLCEGVDR